LATAALRFVVCLFPSSPALFLPFISIAPSFYLSFRCPRAGGRALGDREKEEGDKIKGKEKESKGNEIEIKTQQNKRPFC